MAFGRAANKKQLTFSEVSAKTKLPEDEVTSREKNLNYFI